MPAIPEDHVHRPVIETAASSNPVESFSPGDFLDRRGN